MERVKHFGELEREAELHRKNDPEDWPSNGQIAFEDVELRYRPDLPTVLKGLNFAVRSGEKVGIIGRTGAGKSSIVQALYRTIEICEGKISVDGVDVNQLGLETVSDSCSS